MKFQFESLSDFLNMAGHGPYVWASYGVTFIVLVALVLQPYFARKHFANQLSQLVQRKTLQESQEQK